MEINVSDLPTDSGSGGFDTMRTNLFMSGNRFEQYHALGREALEEAFAWQAAANVEKKLHYEAETTTPIVTKFVAYQIDARERAQRRVKAVEEAAARPHRRAMSSACSVSTRCDGRPATSPARRCGRPSRSCSPRQCFSTSRNWMFAQTRSERL